MDASSLQKAAKREIIVTPFATQLDEIDKALFEHRYRKQSHNHHQYSNIKYGTQGSHRNNGHSRRNHHHNNNNNGQHHHHQHQYQHHQQHQFQTQHNSGGYGVKSQCGSSYARSSPAPVVQQQHQAYAQMQQPHASLMVQQQGVHRLQASQYNHHQSQQLYGIGSGSVVARSPDSFIEGVGGLHNSSSKLEGFSLNLSSSISSGAGSTSSYSSIEYEMQNKLPPVSAISTNAFSMKEGYNTNDGARANESNVINEGTGLESFGSVSNNSNRGWLNIWGSDMSVWG